MVFEHYLLLLLSIVPIIYRYSFWLYIIQLKEYRWDRFSEYISTPQWKSAVVNIWSVLELPLFLISLIIFINSPFEIIIYNVLFMYFIIQNIFIFRKIIKWNFLKPKLTWRLLMTLAILIPLIALEFYFIIFAGFTSSLYSYLLLVILFSPIYIYLSIVITLPIVNYFKNKKINRATSISNKVNKPIKIGITWSYWKSSVKEFLASVLEQDWTTLKTPNNINTEIWISTLLIRKLSDKYKYFIAEMWAYKIGEISLLWKIVNHKYWFLTAIWNQHIALFGSQKNISIGKCEIAESVLKNKGILYINWNNSNIRKAKFDKKLKIVKYWNYKWADTNYEILWLKNGKTEFIFEYKKNKSIFSISRIGEHNIVNITWVLAFCYDLWLKTIEIKKYLNKLKSPKNTLAIIEKNNQKLIDDTYNLSEDWLIAWIEVLNSFEWTKALVVDDILELWAEAEKIHYNLWKKISKEYRLNKIFFVWVNYKKEFEKWLKDWWSKEVNIINSTIGLNEINIILFEGRKSLKYLSKLKK